MSGRMTLHAHLLLKGPQHGFVVEGAALHHDVAAQLFRAGGADDLVQRVFDDARWTGPREMFSIEAPSFCACLTEEFMNTVQREPRSTGLVGKQAQLRRTP